MEPHLNPWFSGPINLYSKWHLNQFSHFAGLAGNAQQYIDTQTGHATFNSTQYLCDACDVTYNVNNWAAEQLLVQYELKLGQAALLQLHRLMNSIRQVATMCTRKSPIYIRLTALCPGLPRWAGTRKVKPIWILLEQETVGGSGISWNICKSAPRSRQITTPAPHHSVFTGRMPFLPPN